ncbi:MAG: PASTA domain-containing protein [bacterium]|nr:PASTA domain-containing protein [bacterium]
MKKKILLLSKIAGLILFYCLVLVLSIFLTMSFLIKGEELEAPDFQGKSLTEAYDIAAKHGLYLKKIVGNYDKNYKPLTVINQMPAAGVRIKEKSFVKVFVSSDVVEVIVPELTGYNITESEKILSENDLKKRYISYMDASDAPVDFVISQSYPPGARVPAGTDIDILASKGNRNLSYIMPDIIGKPAAGVLVYFENLGLKTPKVTKVSYPGLEPDVVIKQYPLSGYRINSKARISVEVSQ